MSRRWLTPVPIIFGAAAGGLIALVGSSRPEPPARASVTASSTIVRSPVIANVAAAASATSSAALPLPTLADSGTRGIANAPAPAPSASAAPSASPAFDLSEPATEAALTEAQIACNRASPEACERAARGLDHGQAGVKDPTRARALRRIALTLYVKQCESARVLACARLAEMYDAGEIVQVNPRNAAALRRRVEELCRARTSDPECRR